MKWLSGMKTSAGRSYEVSAPGQEGAETRKIAIAEATYDGMLYRLAPLNYLQRACVRFADSQAPAECCTRVGVTRGYHQAPLESLDCLAVLTETR